MFWMFRDVINTSAHTAIYKGKSRINLYTKDKTFYLRELNLLKYFFFFS